MPIRFIQVGVGVRGNHWAHVLQQQPAAEAVAYVDTRLDFARRRAAEWGHPDLPCFVDLETALAQVPCDVVLLATPPEVHHSQALMAFRAHKHVLSEKPLTEDLSEAIDIVTQAQAHGVLIMVGMNFRYLPVSQAIRKLVTEREFGEPGYGHFVYLRNRDGRRPDLNKYPLTMAQPMLLEQSIHHFDLLRYCYDGEVVSVQATTWRPAWSTYEHECCVSALFEFENKMQVNYIGTWTTGWNGFQFQWRTDCSGGVIFQDDMFGDLKVARLDPTLAMQGKLNKSPDEVEPLVSVPLPPTRQYLDDTGGLLQEFVNALEKRQPLQTSGADHLKTLALVFACIESSDSGHRIKMHDFYLRHKVLRQVESGNQ